MLLNQFPAPIIWQVPFGVDPCDPSISGNKSGQDTLPDKQRRLSYKTYSYKNLECALCLHDIYWRCWNSWTICIKFFHFDIHYQVTDNWCHISVCLAGSQKRWWQKKQNTGASLTATCPLSKSWSDLKWCQHPGAIGSPAPRYLNSKTVSPELQLWVPVMWSADLSESLFSLCFTLVRCQMKSPINRHEQEYVW